MNTVVTRFDLSHRGSERHLYYFKVRSAFITSRSEVPLLLQGQKHLYYFKALLSVIRHGAHPSLRSCMFTATINFDYYCTYIEPRTVQKPFYEWISRQTNESVSRDIKKIRLFAIKKSLFLIRTHIRCYNKSVWGGYWTDQSSLRTIILLY